MLLYLERLELTRTRTRTRTKIVISWPAHKNCLHMTSYNKPVCFGGPGVLAELEVLGLQLGGVGGQLVQLLSAQA